MTTKKNKFKLDIFEVLNHINAGDMEYYGSLTATQKKAFSPVLVYNWLLGSASPQELLLLDGLVNTQVFEIHKNPEILYKLMVSCMTPIPNRKFKFLRVKTNKTVNSVACKVIAEYYSCSPLRAEEYYPLLNVEDIKEMAYDMGYEAKEIKKIK